MNWTDRGKKFRALLTASKRVAIVSHVNPDGDNLGSLHALYWALEEFPCEVHYIATDSVPKEFEFLSSVAHRRPYEGENYDLVIFLDASDPTRLGPQGQAIFESGKYTVNVDHHQSNPLFGDFNVVDTEATSTGAVLYQLLQAAEIPITAEMATGLYAAISTDTGSFQYDSVNGDTHRIIGDLLNRGADQQTFVQSVYQSKSREKIALLTRVGSGMRYFYDGKVVVSTCTLEDLKETGADNHDTEGIVEFTRDVAGVEVALFLKERKNAVKVSLRSKSTVDVTKIAALYGGGGHIRAAGATAHDSMEVTEKRLLEKIGEYL
ncbi:MAG: bifunctional oligoribonuclease/PAP phosphatase NrnA [Tissierellia bacterium]|nr:bifunctional oligoribonuclease/PAP phosphatase NrnA [Tissierellia bacterium]